MNILGINGGFRPGYQDVSTCLAIDGKALFAIEEERLSRVKFSAGKLPYLAVREALDFAGLKMQDISSIGFHGSTWEPEITDRIRNYFISHFGIAPPIHRYHHHDCHSVSAYYASGFEDALVVTVDNSGDGVSTQISEGRKGKLNTIARFSRPNSYGIFYSIITQYCGFVRDSDEYKLMGLAPYGDNAEFSFDWLLDFREGELKLNTDYIISVPSKAPSTHRDEMIFNQKFLDKMGMPRRLPKSEYVQFYKNVAASAQTHLEKTMLKMLKYFVEKTGLRKICLGGGVALNCVMNQKIMNADFTESLFVQPASSDAGISLGAAWLAGLDKGVAPVRTKDTFLGNAYSNEQIKTTLEGCNLKYIEANNPAATAADLIAKNKVIGWFQDRMEYGPRALGNRSILANPAVAEMKDIVNKKVKFRDSFRPFCPSVLQEDAQKYFIGKQAISPYMTITYDVRKEMQAVIPAVTHVDGTARIQTVNELQNPLYYSLLKELKEKTGHGVVLNTSFNLSHEPIVCTPRDAIASFYASGLDALVIGKFVIEK